MPARPHERACPAASAAIRGGAPPGELIATDRQRAAWAAVWPRAAAVPAFDPRLDRLALAVLVIAYCHYQEIREEARRAPTDQARAVLEAIAEASRANARVAAARMLLIPAERVHLATVDERGDDRELEALFVEASD